MPAVIDAGGGLRLPQPKKNNQLPQPRTGLRLPTAGVTTRPTSPPVSDSLRAMPGKPQTAAQVAAQSTRPAAAGTGAASKPPAQTANKAVATQASLPNNPVDAINQIVALKRAAEAGDPTAHQKALAVYSQLEKMGYSNTARALQGMNAQQAAQLAASPQSALLIEAQSKMLSGNTPSDQVMGLRDLLTTAAQQGNPVAQNLVTFGTPNPSPEQVQGYAQAMAAQSQYNASNNAAYSVVQQTIPNLIQQVVSAGPDVQALTAQALGQMSQWVQQAIDEYQRQAQQFLGGVDPATMAALAQLQQTVDTQRQQLLDEMNRRGLLQSGIALYMEQQLNQGQLTQEQQILAKSLAAVQQQFLSGLQDIITRGLSGAQSLINTGLQGSINAGLQNQKLAADLIGQTLPWTLGPTPEQEAQLQLQQEQMQQDWAKALLPYEQMTAYQQAQVNLDQQRLAEDWAKAMIPYTYGPTPQQQIENALKARGLADQEAKTRAQIAYQQAQIAIQQNRLNLDAAKFQAQQALQWAGLSQKEAQAAADNMIKVYQTQSANWRAALPTGNAGAEPKAPNVNISPAVLQFVNSALANGHSAAEIATYLQQQGVDPAPYGLPRTSQITPPRTAKIAP
ncbi:MAG: hypothetical protein QJR08_04355 [Bacillota bacterium]|nr:hypothetical protein [Bacillota bacterium]